MGERSVDTGSIHLTINEDGVGGLPLMLVHGFTGAKEDFADFVVPLAQRGWHVVAPDLRGHGASDKPTDEAAYTLPIFAGDVLALADTLGWTRFTLLGHSMGGMIAQHMVIGAPDRIDALVLMDTAHGPLEGLVDPATIGRAIDFVRANGIDAWKVAQDANPALRSPADERVRAERPGYIEFGDRKLLASSPAMVASVLGQFASVDDRLEQLAAHSTPTLVIVGEQDLPFVRPSQRMADVMPGASLAVIPDGGHSPQFEAPDAWWSALSSFLDRVQEEAAA
ncbi:MAG TPA: alpha/beta hydrolase [Acidimicrobiales bacterium]|nr:alpha/beta hydrolase [Acidimicrobiales bacterium]